MSQQQTMNSHPDWTHTIMSTTSTKLTCHYNDSYEAVVHRFRFQVPQLDILRLQAATNEHDVKRVLEDISSPSGFVRFADYDHAGWMRHFPAQGMTMQRAHRFTFGNPLYALLILQHNIEAAIHIPLDCCFIEQPDDDGTKLVLTSPTSLRETVDENGDLKRALADLEAKIFMLVQDLVAQS